MTRLHVWLGLALAALLALPGCSEVDHCKRGALRCLGGECENRECDFDLVCVQRAEQRDQLCGKRIRGDRYDFGDEGESDGVPVDEVPEECDCEAPETCSGDTGECVNYCEEVEMTPSSVPPPEAIFCEHESGEEPFTVEEICTNRCKLSCQRWAQFCGFTCEDDFCEQASVLEACAGDCPASKGDQLACLTLACNTVRDQTCGSVTCPDGESGTCQDLTCRNTCGPSGSPGMWAGDGECDDGDLYSATSAACAYGTDCLDCGPRSGDPMPPQPHAGLCAFNTGCRGYSEDLTKNSAWCLDLGEVQPGLSRCVPDCSQNQGCPPGYECVTTVDAEGMPIEQDGITGQACYPTLCEQN